jgi:MFS family permease
MILAATQLLKPDHGVAHAAQLAGILYVGHNVFYAASSYPAGAISDRIGRRGLLALGYLTGAVAALGLLAAFHWRIVALPYLLLPFALGGISVAIVEALEGALTADFVEESTRGTAYGVIGTVNGIGDLVASLAVGFLWTAFSPVLAFTYAAILMAIGAAVIYTFI